MRDVLMGIGVRSPKVNCRRNSLASLISYLEILLKIQLSKFIYIHIFNGFQEKLKFKKNFVEVNQLLNKRANFEY